MRQNRERAVRFSQYRRSQVVSSRQAAPRRSSHAVFITRQYCSAKATSPHDSTWTHLPTQATAQYLPALEGTVTWHPLRHEPEMQKSDTAKNTLRTTTDVCISLSRFSPQRVNMLPAGSMFTLKGDDHASSL